MIDDEADMVELTVWMLHSAGNAAFGSTQGQRALNLVIEVSADVVVLDYNMAQMNGADVGKALRSGPATKDVRIIMQSATPEATIRKSFWQYDTCVAKPSLDDSLLLAIESD